MYWYFAFPEMNMGAVILCGTDVSLIMTVQPDIRGFLLAVSKSFHDSDHVILVLTPHHAQPEMSLIYIS